MRGVLGDGAVGDGGAVGESAIAGEAGRESTANEVDGKLRMGKGIEEEEEFLPAAS